MTEVRSGAIVIRKAATNFGIDAISIINIDGNKESVMMYEEDWDDLLKAVKRMNKLIKKERRRKR